MQFEVFCTFVCIWKLETQHSGQVSTSQAPLTNTLAGSLKAGQRFKEVMKSELPFDPWRYLTVI